MLEKINSLLHILSQDPKDMSQVMDDMQRMPASFFSLEEKEMLIQQLHTLNVRTEELLLFLCTIDPHNACHWIELGISRMRTQAYDSALTALGTAATLSPTAPLPYLLSAACYVHTAMKDQVALCLEMCMELSKKNRAYEELYEIAQQCYHNNCLLNQISQKGHL